MKETRILLASVLKPVNDARMFRKLGLSLAKLPLTQVYIAGYDAPLPDAPENISFYPLFRFRRLGLGRITASWHYLKLVWQLKPLVIIVGTHELLMASLVYKILRPCRLIYDVRENYYLNLTTQRIYLPWVSLMLGYSIRLIEKLAARSIQTFFLAEKCYATELPFLHQNYLVLENKYQPVTRANFLDTPLPARSLPPDNIQLLYSGTISELYGVFEAVDLLNALNQVAPIFKLTIIGYSPQPEIFSKLLPYIKGNPAITIIGGNKLIPHPQIIQAIHNSHLGLLPYRPHPSTNNCIPTKLFEYLGNGLPVLIQKNRAWEKLVQEFKAGLAIDFKNIAGPEIYHQLLNTTFYANNNPANLYWQSEEKKLLQWAQTNILN